MIEMRISREDTAQHAHECGFLQLMQTIFRSTSAPRCCTVFSTCGISVNYHRDREHHGPAQVIFEMPAEADAASYFAYRHKAFYQSLIRQPAPDLLWLFNTFSSSARLSMIIADDQHCRRRENICSGSGESGKMSARRPKIATCSPLDRVKGKM